MPQMVSQSLNRATSVPVIMSEGVTREALLCRHDSSSELVTLIVTLTHRDMD